MTREELDKMDWSEDRFFVEEDPATPGRAYVVIRKRKGKLKGWHFNDNYDLSLYRAGRARWHGVPYFFHCLSKYREAPKEEITMMLL